MKLAEKDIKETLGIQGSGKALFLDTESGAKISVLAKGQSGLAQNVQVERGHIFAGPGCVLIKNDIQAPVELVFDNVIDQTVENSYALYLGDSCEIIKGIPDDSIHYTLFSPPFASLYTYSNSDRDMGNCKGDDEFYRHFTFLARELYRVTMPGRLLSFHCMDLPRMKERDGVIELKDFPAIIRQVFEDCGFIYHSRVTIWKNLVTEMQRTKALGLLHKQIKKDSAMNRQGSPDYIITMRKPGDNPERVTHTNESFPCDVWQQYASPVWMDIKQSNTLNRKAARAEEDERHICPLQLDVIQRCIELRTNPHDIVFDPFGGIGSTAYVARSLNRRAISCELKKSYYEQMVLNVHNAEVQYLDAVGDQVEFESFRKDAPSLRVAKEEACRLLESLGR